MKNSFVNIEENADTDDSELTFNGMFNGIKGKYTCSLDCKISWNPNDTFSFTALETGTLSVTFTPTTDYEKITIPGAKGDTDYLAFGYWLQTNDTMAYGVGTFAEGSMPFAVADISALRGSAKYAGSAVGMYTKNSFSSGGVSSLDETGQFTANVKLTANFGGDTVESDDLYTISGSVSSFKNAAGMIIDNSWNLTLGKAPFAAGARGSNRTITDNSHTNTFNGTTALGGKWTGMFYGSPHNDDAKTDDDDTLLNATTYPSGIAGEFDGGFTNGRVIGAFGATEQ